VGKAWIDNHSVECPVAPASGVELNLVRGEHSVRSLGKCFRFAAPRSELRLLRALSGLGCLSLLLAGCAQKPAGDAAAPVVSFRVHGAAYGGQQPVSDATIQLYAVGTAGDGSAATPLLTQAVTSDANGEFTLSGYVCPTPSTLVYLTATGGNPGLPNGLTNPQLALMAALGACGSLTPTTTINVNELTTVTAVWPLAPFMSSYSAIGSGSSDATALASAFATAAILANTSTGTVPGLSVPSGTTVPVTQIFTLADALASCINSAGGVAGDKSACGILFAAATPPGGAAPVNVISAGMDLANNPTLDSSSLFSLVGGKSPFQPTLTSPPANLAVQLSSTSAGLSFSTTGLTFSAAYLNFPSALQSITVTNNGSNPVNLSTYGVQVVGAAAADFSFPDGQTFDGVLFPQQTWTIEIAFLPTASGARNATLLFGPVGAPAQAIALSGTGLAHTGSSVSLSPSSLTFSLPGIPQPVIVTNNGMTPIVIGPITISSTPSGSIASETNNCGALLPAQSICTIQVEATDVQTSKLNYGPSGTVTLTVMDGGNPGIGTVSVNVPLTSEISFTPGAFDFGVLAVGVTSPALSNRILAYLTNSGAPFNVPGSIVGPNASDFSLVQNNTFDQSNPSFVLDYYYVTFKPTAGGPRTATLVTGYGNIPLSGYGLPGPSGVPSFSLSASGLVNNTGTAVLTLSVTITGPDSGAFSGDPGPFTLAPTETVQLAITSSALHLGVNTATLTVTDTTSGISKSIPLSVYGYPPSPSVTPGSITFSSARLGVQSAPQTIAISAPNGDPVSITSIAGYPLSNDFAISSGTCAQTPCQVTATFTPSQTGTESAGYTVEDLVTYEQSSISLQGKGGVGSVSLSSSSLTYAARDIGTTSIPQTVTLTNAGDATLTLSGETFAGANVGDFPIESSTCGSSLAAGANCTLTISFAPTASGTRSATLQIMTNAASSPDNIQLMGTGN
jgi:hypothetical protein